MSTRVIVIAELGSPSAPATAVLGSRLKDLSGFLLMASLGLMGIAFQAIALRKEIKPHYMERIYVSSAQLGLAVALVAMLNIAFVSRPVTALHSFPVLTFMIVPSAGCLCFCFSIVTSENPSTVLTSLLAFAMVVAASLLFSMGLLQACAQKLQAGIVFLFLKAVKPLGLVGRAFQWPARH